MSDIEAVQIAEQRSVWVAQWLTHRTAGMRYDPPVELTIEGGLGVQRPVSYGNSAGIRYMVVGNKGCRESEHGHLHVISRHRSDDITPRGILPLLILPYREDNVRQDEYRLRKEVVVGGRHYVVYYAKVLSHSGDIDHYSTSPMLDERNPIIPDSNYNAPRPVSALEGRSLDGEDIDAVNYRVSSTTFELHLDQRDEQRIQHACQMLFGGSTNTWISELFLCFGEDRLATRWLFGGSPFEYLEASCVQPASMMAFSPVKRFHLRTDIGSVLPMKESSDVTT